MEGEKIGAVNNAVRDVLKIMPEIQEDTADVDIKISALTFSDDAKWVTSEPMSPGEFQWKDFFEVCLLGFTSIDWWFFFASNKKVAIIPGEDKLKKITTLEDTHAYVYIND